MENDKSNKKKIKNYIGPVVLLICFYLGYQYFYQTDSINKTMMKAASEINKNCPFMIGADTRLDNTTAMPNNLFHFNFSLVNISIDEIDIETFKQNFYENVRPSIINDGKTNPELKAFRDNKISMRYSYKDKDGVFISQFIIEANEYAN